MSETEAIAWCAQSRFIADDESMEKCSETVFDKNGDQHWLVFDKIWIFCSESPMPFHHDLNPYGVTKQLEKQPQGT